MTSKKYCNVVGLGMDFPVSVNADRVVCISLPFAIEQVSICAN